ncbi:MAG: hypothetical protein ACRDNR_14600 [Gaiellaceae bacterium]
MIDSWINDLVLTLSGLITGALIGAVGILTPPDRARRAERRPGESFLEASRRAARESPHAPRSALIASLGLWGFLAVLIVSIALSPLEMRWLLFFAGLAVGALAINGLGWLVRQGKLPVLGETRLERALREKVLGRS